MNLRRAAAISLISLVAACASERDESGPESPPVTSEAIPLSPHRALARTVDDYLVNYAGWDAAKIAIAQRHDLVVVDPNESGLTRSTIAAIQEHGAIVVCYLSVGEDQRTADMTDAEMLADPRFVGDGSGPRVDPRGPYHDGEPLGGIAPLGLPSNGGTGYASWYLDDVSVRNDPDNVGDGRPDRNGNFGAGVANAGDPKWFDALQGFTFTADRIAGLREILTTTYGRGLGCDGVFLDTIDTAAPNGWTDAASSNETKYEWTAPGFAAFLTRLRATYPDIVIVQNRGLFFFNPWNPHFAFIPRGQLDFVLFESYRLNSASTDNPHPYFYPDNRYNFAPKLLAEASRSDGFRVLSLGYAEGPADQMDERTLVGESTLGTDSLLEDIRVTERLVGFRHYLTNSTVTLVNEFVADHADRSDAEPPVWTSTYNDHWEYPEPPGEPTPRVGLQQVVAADGALTLRWDVARDGNRVRYALYYQTAPFDFVGDPGLTQATRVVLDPRPSAAYSTAVGPGIYANEATLTGLEPGRTYYLLIRAFDESPAANEDTNQVVLTGVPAGAPPYLGRLRASNGTTSLTYRMQYSETWGYRRVYVDRDRVAGTGWNKYGIGADFLLENGNLYRYTGDGATWSWQWVKGVALTSGAVDGMTWVQWDLAQADLGATTASRVVFQLQRSGAVNTAPVYEHVYTTTDPASPYRAYYVENDATRVYFHVEITQPYSYRHVFVDTDGDPGTGYRIGGVGADYMIENASLYRFVGPTWAWTKVGSAGQVVVGTSHDWSIARADVGAADGSPRFDVVFQANGGSTSFVAPVYAHPFTR